MRGFAHFGRSFRSPDLGGVHGDGNKTAELTALGAYALARIWESAWKVGNGKAVGDSKLKAIPEKTLSKLYLDKSFVRSVDLDSIKRKLK